MKAKPLTPLQLQTVHALMTERTVTKAAAKVGIGRSTIYAWKRNNPNFRSALVEIIEKLREQLWQDARAHYRLSPRSRG